MYWMEDGFVLYGTGEYQFVLPQCLKQVCGVYDWCDVFHNWHCLESLRFMLSDCLGICAPDCSCPTCSEALAYWVRLLPPGSRSGRRPALQSWFLCAVTVCTSTQSSSYGYRVLGGLPQPDPRAVVSKGYMLIYPSNDGKRNIQHK